MACCTQLWASFKERTDPYRKNIALLMDSVTLLLLLLDVGLDIVTAVRFYHEGSYVPLGVLIVVLVGSSLLVQAYSWVWYSNEIKENEYKKEEEEEEEEEEEKNVPGIRPDPWLLKFLHVFQLGIYLRHLEVLKMSYHSRLFERIPQGTLSVKQDVAMLRVVEMFSESLPELVLMITITLQRGHLVPITVLKAAVKVCSASYCVTSFHRSLSSFPSDEHRETFSAYVVYFLWNLLLISARVTALSLFASELPCFIFAHFICSWILLYFCAWRSQTDFMDSKCGEWLHRATLGLIWYFNLFNFSDIVGRPLLYHCYSLADITLLCGLWFWKMNPDLPNFNYEHAIAYVCIFFVYIFGLVLFKVFDKYLHQHVPKSKKTVSENDLKEAGECKKSGEAESGLDERGRQKWRPYSDIILLGACEREYELKEIELEKIEIKQFDIATHSFGRAAAACALQLWEDDECGSRKTEEGSDNVHFYSCEAETEQRVENGDKKDKKRPKRVNKRMEKLAKNFYS